MSRNINKNKKMNKQRLAILIIAGLGISATFMTWYDDSIFGSMSGTECGSSGRNNFILFLVPLIISLLNDKTKPLNGGLLYCAIIPSIIAGIIGIFYIIDIKYIIYVYTHNGHLPQVVQPFFTQSVGFGLYLVALAGITLPVAAFLVKK